MRWGSCVFESVADVWLFLDLNQEMNLISNVIMDLLFFKK
jgi:hypothetical protein